jgi:tfoX N-domain family protein
MSVQKDFLCFVLEQLSDLEDLSYRSMMGEYVLYYRGKIAAYLCDDRLLVKPVDAAKALLPDAPAEAPYEGAKEMLLVENLENRECLVRLFQEMYPELPLPKAKTKRIH